MSNPLQQKFRQFAKLLSILRRPAAWRAVLAWTPFSITAYQMVQTINRLVPELRTIIDVGANRGQFSRALAETYPEARIIAFEPLPDVAQQLRKNLSDLSNVRVESTAVGAHNGTLTFHRYAYTLQSSPLRRISDHPHNPDSANGGDTLTVPVTRLDTVLNENSLHSPCLLKLDVQGFELKVLEGSRDILSATDYILVETSFREAYEDQPLFDELYAYLQNRGFHMLAPVDVLTDENGVITQADILFEQKQR